MQGEPTIESLEREVEFLGGELTKALHREAEARRLLSEGQVLISEAAAAIDGLRQDNVHLRAFARKATKAMGDLLHNRSNEHADLPGEPESGRP
jgi:hypothetical protein